MFEKKHVDAAIQEQIDLLIDSSPCLQKYTDNKYYEIICITSRATEHNGP